MKISIITPSYNSGIYIDKSIQAVLNQDYDNWEHVIVDGGSTDATIDILKKYQHLRWLSEQDQGIYDAMNKGIKMATGDWICFLGADDYFYQKHTLSEVIEYMNSELHVLYGDVINLKSGLMFSGAFDEERIFKENICHQGIFFRKEVFEMTGSFDTKYKVLSDWDHNMKWLLHDKINSKYIDVKIACFGGNGLSSITGDQEFYKDKRCHYMKYAIHKSNSAFVRKFAFVEMKRAIKKISIGLFMTALICYFKNVDLTKGRNLLEVRTSH